MVLCRVKPSDFLVAASSNDGTKDNLIIILLSASLIFSAVVASDRSSSRVSVDCQLVLAWGREEILFFLLFDLEC